VFTDGLLIVRWAGARPRRSAGSGPTNLVEPPARVEPHALAIAPHDQPLPVVFYFVDPGRPGRWLFGLVGRQGAMNTAWAVARAVTGQLGAIFPAFGLRPRTCEALAFL